MQGLDIPEDSKLKSWREIFVSWFDELEKVVKLSDGHDAPYVHAEHGSTHHFGVSASKAGLGTIREVYGKRNDHNARLDLCLISENSLDIVESKWIEFDCSKPIPHNSIISGIERACSDAVSYKNNNSLFNSKDRIIRRSGVLFISLYFKDDDVNMLNIKESIDYINYNIKYDILAWSFPVSARGLKYWGRVYPGTIAVVRCIEK